MTTVEAWIAHVVEREVPAEYLGSALSQDVRDALRQSDDRLAWVALIGPPGVGKTRQAWAAYQYARANQLRRAIARDGDADEVRQVAESTERPVRVITESDIDAHRYDEEWLGSIVSYRGTQVIDDLGYAREADRWTLRAVYTIANIRRAGHLPTVWTTNLTPQQLAAYYTPAIASRILGGVVIETPGVDRRQEAAGAA